MTWTEEKINEFKRFYPYHSNKELARYFKVTVSAIKNKCSKLRLRKKIENTGCFKKGQETWNKGKKHPSTGNTALTQFKAGQNPHNTKYDGAISIRQSKGDPPYKYIRIVKAVWVLLHRYNWEKKYGKIPEGMVLRSKGDSLNVNPDNWQLITMAINVRMNENREAQSIGLKKRWRIKHLREIYELD